MWARIESGVVREITEIDPAGRFHPSIVWEPCGADVREGWTFDGKDFAAPEPVEPVVPVPQSITKRQLLLGLMSDQWITPAEAEAWADNTALPGPINDVINAMPAEQQPAARITAKTMSVAERDNPLFRAAAQAAMPEASEEDIDAALDQAFIAWADL